VEEVEKKEAKQPINGVVGGYVSWDEFFPAAEEVGEAGRGEKLGPSTRSTTLNTNINNTNITNNTKPQTNPKLTNISNELTISSSSSLLVKTNVHACTHTPIHIHTPNKNTHIHTPLYSNLTTTSTTLTNNTTHNTTINTTQTCTSSRGD